MLITLKNDLLTVSADSAGAELHSLRFDGTEYLWQCGSAWKRYAPVLFPFICSPKDGLYRAEGREYKMPSNHGFARDMTFKAGEITESSMSFVLSSDESTRAVYPYDFEFTVAYELSGSSVRVINKTRNTGDKTMYFYVGGHPAFNCPLGTDSGTCFGDWYVKYERPETIVQDFNGVRTIIDGTDTLPLSRALFDNDVIMKDAPESKSIELRSDKCSRFVRVDFPESRCIAVWSPAGNDEAAFVCLEPWTSVPVYADDEFPDLEKKPHAIALDPGCEHVYSYTITVG
ncbi:MAG: aldose 1-epimerase family protein [Ruminococcus sp.]|nr:aldose 1-epimerase family protein [Ruminococcus sp.]